MQFLLKAADNQSSPVSWQFFSSSPILQSSWPSHSHLREMQRLLWHWNWSSSQRSSQPFCKRAQTGRDVTTWGYYTALHLMKGKPFYVENIPESTTDKVIVLSSRRGLLFAAFGLRASKKGWVCERAPVLSVRYSNPIFKVELLEDLAGTFSQNI